MIETTLLAVSSGALAASLVSLLNKYLFYRKRRRVKIEVDGREFEISDIHHLRNDEVEVIIRTLSSAGDGTDGEVKGVS